MTDVITERELNRALLARQGLLERLANPLGQVVESVGALQMQHWPSLLPALWSRTAGCAPDAPFRAHATGELLTGTLLRGTIHTVSASQFPAYSAVAAASATARWWRSRTAPGPAAEQLRRELQQFASEPRSPEQLSDFVEEWLARHPGGLDEDEIARQRPYRWRALVTSVGMVRVPGDGQWHTRTPKHLQAATALLGDGATWPDLAEALPTVVTSHLRAFGPAAAEDVASWIGWTVTPVRKVLERLPGLTTVTDEAGRTLYDLVGAPRPPADTPAPARLLPAYDSALLAHAPAFRTRILPAAHRDTVYIKANAQLKPTVLIDGFVAGLWSITTARGRATLAITPLGRLTKKATNAALTEAERLIIACQPEAKSREVAIVEP